MKVAGSASPGSLGAWGCGPAMAKRTPTQHSTCETFCENNVAKVVLKNSWQETSHPIAICIWLVTIENSKQLHSMFLGNALCAATAGGHLQVDMCLHI